MQLFLHVGVLLHAPMYSPHGADVLCILTSNIPMVGVWLLREIVFTLR